MRVLLVEDDDRVAAALCDALGRHGFDLHRAATLAQAMSMLADDFDVVLLDLMLPDGNGLELCTHIRSHSNVPILITTARGDLTWRLHGLNLGADDYLVKPYDIRELMARIAAVAWRAKVGVSSSTDSAPAARVLIRQGLEIDLDRQQVSVGGEPVFLTRKEFGVIAELAENPGVVVRRERLLSTVWNSMYHEDNHTLTVHIAAIRTKTGAPGLIETVRGVGYRLADE